MLEHNWIAIAILDGHLKLRVEPSLDCVMYCDTSLFVTLKPRDLCKINYCSMLLFTMYHILVVFNADQWTYGGQAFSDHHVVYYTTSFNKTNVVLHTQ